MWGRISAPAQEEILRLVDARGEKARSAMIGMQPFHQGSMRLVDLGGGRTRRKTKDLIGVLLCHGARLRRGVMPCVLVRIEVFTPSGHPAVEISFK